MTLLEAIKKANIGDHIYRKNTNVTIRKSDNHLGSENTVRVADALAADWTVKKPTKKSIVISDCLWAQQEHSGIVYPYEASEHNFDWDDLLSKSKTTLTIEWEE